MDLVISRRIVLGSAIAGALLAGWQIAHGSFGLVGVTAATALLLTANMWLRVTPDVLAGGAVLIGYLVGNRGFAQLHVPRLPLLPGEMVLLLAFACGAWRWARSQRLPVRRDALNVLLLLWIVVTTVRLPWDFRIHGFTAVRDYAIVYYAAFFFLGQLWGEDETNRRWIHACLTTGFALTVPAFAAFVTGPEWFTTKLFLFGVPIILVKSDVAGGFMAAGTFWFAHRYASTRRIRWLGLCAVAMAGVATSNSRAALLALLFGVAWLVIVRAWATMRVVISIAVLGLIALGVQTVVTNKSTTQAPFFRLYESVLSIADFQGVRTYHFADLGDKPDNNQFRIVWWRTVAEEAWVNGRWTGLGFGHDLAREFSRIYYGDASEDFSSRSPHNFLLTVFARTGLVGLVLFMAAVGVMAVRTWQAGRGGGAEDGDSPVPLWLTGWCILASACFGVVLEGPMGATVFWTALGLANAAMPARRGEPEELENTEFERERGPDIRRLSAPAPTP